MANVYIDYRTISWGAPNEDDNTNVWQVEDGNADPGEILLANFGNVGTPVHNFPATPTYMLGKNTYGFAFWNATDGVNAITGFPATSNLLNIPDMPPGVVHATAWYALPGGPGTGVPGLRARTFDVDLNNFRKETPVQSVNPAAAWPGPNNHSVSSENADASTTAKETLLFPAAVPSQPPGEPNKYFQQWLSIVGAVTISAPPSRDVRIAKAASALAVAFFGHGRPTPHIVGKPATESISDYWAEFWGRRGAEGEGPFGPGGPGDPWGPLVARVVDSLNPVERGMALGLLQGISAAAAKARQ